MSTPVNINNYPFFTSSMAIVQNDSNMIDVESKAVVVSSSSYLSSYAPELSSPHTYSELISASLANPNLTYNNEPVNNIPYLTINGEYNVYFNSTKHSDIRTDTFSCNDNDSLPYALTNDNYDLHINLSNLADTQNYSIVVDWGVLGTETLSGTINTCETKALVSTKLMSNIVGAFTISWSGSCNGSITLEVLESEILNLTTSSEIQFYDSNIVINDIQNKGSAVLAISNNKIVCTSAGTIFNLIINNGDYLFPCAEFVGWTLHDVRQPERAYVNNHSWTYKEKVAYNYIYGYTLLDNGVHVPYNENKIKIYNDI